jgi:CRP-like cAMP-binding protein
MVNRRSLKAVESCGDCPMGAVSGVGQGGKCPWVEGRRPASAFLYLAGEPADTILHIKQGAVMLSRATGPGRDDDVTWAVRRPGALLGMEGLVRDTYLDTARAVTDVVVCTATRTDVDAWLDTREGAGRALLECMMLAQCADAPRRSSSEGSAQRRVACWVLEQADDPPPALPRTAVAALLGMLPETLSRSLATLARRGLIAVSRKKVEILDAAGLEEVAAGDRT